MSARSVPCASCGQTAYLGTRSRPASEAMCNPCRREAYARTAKPCLICGETFSPRSATGVVCSATCRTAYLRKAGAARYQRIRPRERDCVVCSRSFPIDGHRAVCSDTCAKTRQRARWLNRQAAMRGAFVAPVNRLEIFQRDRWRCYRCGCRLLKTASIPNPRTATLDHLVPLTRDGTHEPANVRACCYACNLSKGNRGGNEQLLLIG